jgi:hypothetical protein
MRNRWYGDNRDLVKWSVLIHLAKMYSANRILQIAYFREDDFEKMEIDTEQMNIPAEVKAHFREIRNIKELASSVKISVFDTVLTNRKQYINAAKEFIASFKQERCIVFLDPDTGLEPKKLKPNHELDYVLNQEAKDFWDILKPLDVLSLYQHQTNRRGELWEETKREQFEKAINAKQNTVKIGRGIQLARDVVLFYVQKA